MLRLLGQVTGTCFQRCVGLDALNAAFATSYEVDQAHGTDYHERFRSYLKHVQEDDLMLAGAMTDPKGHRAKRPSEQDDPDAYVRRGAPPRRGRDPRCEAPQHGWHQLARDPRLPGTGLVEGEEDYAIACAVPADPPGVVFIFGRQSNDSRKLEGGCDIGNRRFGVVGVEAMVVFENVSCPGSGSS